jgi:Protein involved in cell division
MDDCASKRMRADGGDSERTVIMALENKLGITNSAELAREEEKISKKKALMLFESGMLDELEAGTFAALAEIHKYLFSDIYDFAGKVRTVNLAKGNFRFAPLMYLHSALENIDRMPQSAFDEIIEKYVEMNIAHPFREGNGRSTRIWLDQILKKELHQVVDWSMVDKEDYLLAMERSPIRDIEIKHVLKAALTHEINNRDLYMKGIDTSYFYEGYTTFKTEELETEGIMKNAVCREPGD